MSSKCTPDTGNLSFLTLVSKRLDVLPTSKKISKAKSVTSPGEDAKAKADGNDGKKYKTVDSPTKKKILLDLKKAVIIIMSSELKPEDISTTELQKMLDRVEFGAYNKMLTKVLTKHVIIPQILKSHLSSSPTSLLRPEVSHNGEEKLRDGSAAQISQKIVKLFFQPAIILILGGGLLIAHDKLGIFRDRVIQILKSMPARVFLTLRNRILEVLEEFHYDSKDKNQIREFNRNTCSKHWWFNFMRRNQDIKDLWESIPLERMLHKDKHNKEDSTDDSSPLPGPPDTKGEPLTVPNPVMLKMMADSVGISFNPFPASLLQTMQEGLLGEGLSFPPQTNNGEIVKKEEEATPTPIVRTEMAIEPKVEETKTTNQIITKNEEEATKTENTAETNMQPQVQMPMNDMSAPQIDYLPMLLQQKKVIDFLILMRLKRGY